MKRFALLLPVLVGVGCKAPGELPQSLITGPRVLAIKAEPAEVAPGGSSTVTILVAGADGATPAVSWDRCRRAPLPGQSINPDCVTNVGAGASYLEPVGDGLTVTATMPADVTADALGLPDASGGVYLPLVARVTVGGETLLATYRLRLRTGSAINHNPTIAAVYVLDPSGPAPLDEGVARVVHAGDQLTLGVTLADGSAEAYVAPVVGSSGGAVTESLTTSWFATAGEVSNNALSPNPLWSLADHLPASGSTIDLYVVTRDERGGTDYAHRTLQLQ